MANILIVDDQPCVRELLSEKFAYEDYGVGISVTWEAFVGVTAQLKSQSHISLFTLMIFG